MYGVGPTDSEALSEVLSDALSDALSHGFSLKLKRALAELGAGLIIAGDIFLRKSK